jgi:hypothetical protein
MKAYLCRLVFASTIYNIWRNRNALRHNNNLIQHIRWEARIRFAIKGRFKKTRGNGILCSVHLGYR